MGFVYDLHYRNQASFLIEFFGNQVHVTFFLEKYGLDSDSVLDRLQYRLLDAGNPCHNFNCIFS